MTDPTRPDPDALLASIRRSEARDVRGRLKVFFGMAPGVGKTYAMLEAARKAHAEGMDVVVASSKPTGARRRSGCSKGCRSFPAR